MKQASDITAALSSGAGHVLLRVKVVPGASRTKIVGMLGDRLKIAVAAPPEQGKANAALCEHLARKLGVSGRDVEVIEGHTQPRKTVRINGLSTDQIVTVLKQT